MLEPEEILKLFAELSHCKNQVGPSKAQLQAPGFHSGVEL